MNTYECSICWAVNHVSKLHCSYCGTIPAQYSILALPARYAEDEYYAGYINVLVAFGAERQVSRRTIKRTARTVPFDYYAEL